MLEAALQKSVRAQRGGGIKGGCHFRAEINKVKGEQACLHG